MIKCSECGASQMEGALFCSECGNLLYQTDAESTAVLPFSDFSYRTLLPPLTTQNLPAAATPRTLTLLIPSSRRRLRLTLTKELRVGRADAAANFHPEIDFTQDNGAKYGVSRQHAVFRIYEDGAALVDLHSTNGTLLNGFRLQPERPFPVKSGDEIRFGDLLIHLFVE